MSLSPRIIPNLAAALTLTAVLVAAAGCAGVKPTLGPPLPTGMIIYQPPPGGRFDYFLYVSNADPRMEDRQARLERVRVTMAQRCDDPLVVDLYGHEVGTWPDGTPHVTYTVGVDCAPHAGTEP